MSNEIRKKFFLDDRKNFVNVASVIFGTICSAGLIWWFGSAMHFAWWLLLVVVAFAGGRLWAVLMWPIYKGLYAVDERPSGVEPAELNKRD
jgi:hypothetical protein